MSIFGRLKRGAAEAVESAAQSAGTKKETFTFAALPESLAQMQALPEAALTDPFQTAARTMPVRSSCVRKVTDSGCCGSSSCW